MHSNEVPDQVSQVIDEIMQVFEKHKISELESLKYLTSLMNSILVIQSEYKKEFFLSMLEEQIGILLRRANEIIQSKILMEVL